MLSTKANAFAAVAVSTGVILTCTFVVTYLINDINSLYDDIITDLEEIRDINRDAWNNMINMQQKAGGGNSDIRNLFEFRRIKRASSNCNCNENRGKNCPKGAPGPPGEKGEPGEEGEPGHPGLPGAGGIVVLLDLPHAGCIRCPAGPPGPRGPPGAPGLQGHIGPHGNPGRNGNDGRRGPPGQFGDLGVPGREGPPGLDGRPGNDGTRWISSPGLKGHPGHPGYPGPQGDRGNNGGRGEPGEQGPAGTPGYIGNPGRPGVRGLTGNSGLPGRNGEYCPCPTRSAAIPASTGEEELHGAADGGAGSSPNQGHNSGGAQIEVDASSFATADADPSAAGGSEYKKYKKHRKSV